MKFSKANTKLKKLEKKIGRKVYSFDLLSGHTCPGAKDCLAKVNYDWDADTYKLEDGVDQQFRCYSASQEAQYTDVYNHRLENWENVDKYRSANKLAKALDDQLPENAETIRWHSAGDFFNKIYFMAAILVAKRNPDKVFYAYTKFLPAWVKFRGIIPDNFVLTASRGGRWDHLIDEHNLREVVVVFSEEEAEERGLELDDDDSHAARPELRDQNFALLIHGQGQKGSEQSRIFADRVRRNKLAKSMTGGL